MKILYVSKSPDATAYFRSELPAKYLAKMGVEVRMDYIDPVPKLIGSGIKESDCEWADIVVFQRPITESHYKMIKALKTARPNKVIIGEYDDDYSSVPKWNPGYAFIKAYETWWKQIIPLYDAVTVSTGNLADVMRRYTSKPIQVLQNTLDFEEIDKLPSGKEFTLFAPKMENKNLVPMYTVTSSQFNQLMESKIVIYWAGSRFHYFDLDWISDEISSICKENDDVVFLFVGYITEKIVKAVPTNQLFMCQGASPVMNYYSLLKSLKKDIGLAPVDPCEFNESKSCLKVLEIVKMGCIPVSSDFDTYDNSAPSSYRAGYEKGDWVRCIRSAIDDVRNGHNIAMNEENLSFVNDNFNPKSRAIEYFEFYKKMMALKESVNGRKVFDNHSNS